MMPVAEDSKPPDTANYKKKYKALKRKLKFLVFEQECFLDELRKAQRKLLKVSRDRSFLLDRLLQYEKLDDSSSDSDATGSSESEGEGKKDGSGSSKKKKHLQQQMALFGDSTSLLGKGLTSMLSAQAAGGMSAVIGRNRIAITPGFQFGGIQGFHAIPQPALQPVSGLDSSQGEPQKKKAKVTKKVKTGGVNVVKPTPGMTTPSKITPLHTSTPTSIPTTVTMSREEVERHLEIKQSSRPQFMNIDKAPYSLPDDIFSNENSNPGGVKQEKGGPL